jgi:serine/threonine-protein kinase
MRKDSNTKTRSPVKKAATVEGPIENTKTSASKSAGQVQDRIPDKVIHHQLNRILASKTFSQVDRLKRFVGFIVEESLAKRGGDLKEYVIGVQVFGKEDSFDPRTDPIVRVQARRLRARLTKYYADEGQADEVLVEIPKGGYAPLFKRREREVITPSFGAAMMSKNTVAVLPFADLSADGSLGRFCRGLRDEIIQSLTPLKALRVLSAPDRLDRTDRSDHPDAVIVIEGSVRIFGDRMRILAQMVDAVNACYLWSESGDWPVSDPLPAQESIAKAIVARLQPELSESFRPTRASENLAARSLYVQGRYHLNQRTEVSLHKAVEFFERAIVEDAQFSLAHSGLADAYSLLGHYGVLGPAEVLGRAAASAAAAVMLDSQSAEAHATHAHVNVTQDWDWSAAEREFLRAMQLNPKYPTAHHWYATSCLVPTGRLEEALQQMLLAQSLDPVSSIIAKDVALMHFYRRDLDAALDQCDHTIELNPYFAPAYLTLGLIQEQRKEFEESVAAFRRAVNLSPNTPRTHAALARTLALSGKTGEARQGLRTLGALAKARYVSPFEFMMIYFALGETERAHQWLAKACDDRCWDLLALGVDPRFEGLKEEPRFEAAIQRMRLG